ncbi:hypothetical protein PAXINDRAFT_13554 [Paxillus involutus ATCC 200175]|uniref:Uncharacterized protein n=1 Tax=Paxillus involutus ATCC 200175 TaxID=664439 RepID=A0A0C9TTM7_PAXIN|nr:hypothetical protein PAXINDRAFT_13554 [Paxillus involutus ATCC 200175]
MSAHPPPSSIFSTFSRSTAVTSVPDPNHVASCFTDNPLVGGYADEDLLDDSQERGAATQSRRGKGKQVMKTTLQIIMPPSHATTDRAPNKALVSQLGMGTLKRKGVPEDVLSISETDGEQSKEESDIEIIKNDVMDVDVMMPDAAEPIHIKQEPRARALFMSLDGRADLSRNATAKAPAKKHRRTASLPPAKKVKKETIPQPIVLVPDSEGSDSNDVPNNTTVQAPQAAASGYWIEKVFKSRSSYCNTDLPPPLPRTTPLEQNLHPHRFPLIFAVVYPDVRYKISAEGSVFGVVTQRVIEWRSNFGSTALAIMNDFFSHNKDIGTKELAESLLQKCTFLLATVHIHSTIGHADIPNLDTERLAACGITGALATCSTAIERSLICIRDGAFVTKDVLAEATQSLKHTKVQTPKSLNVATRKESRTQYAFSTRDWEGSTLSYLQSISTRGENDLEIITSMAQTVLKK